MSPHPNLTLAESFHRQGGGEHGRVGAWEGGSMGGWEHGRVGAWEGGSMGGLEHGGGAGGRVGAWGAGLGWEHGGARG